jgi:hypothetical protein
VKILLVAEREELRTYMRRNFMPRGAEIILYQNPIKAMDNLDEIDPEVVLFSSEDFPRHWKPFLIFLRNSKTREDCVFVLLAGPSFDHDEADKAQALHVNGIIHEALDDRAEIDRLKELVNRYRDIGDARSEKRLIPTSVDHVGFMFTHPSLMEFVFGTVEDISAAGVSFIPSERRKTVNLSVGSVLEPCSLRVGDYILKSRARVIRNERSLSLYFDSLPDADRAFIRSYVESRTQRELEEIAAPAEELVEEVPEPAPVE